MMAFFMSETAFLSNIGPLNVTGFSPHLYFHSMYGLGWATGHPHMDITLGILMIEAHIWVRWRLESAD